MTGLRGPQVCIRKIDYPWRAECATAPPLSTRQGMRLPAGIEDGNLEQEDEWGISLDLSKVSSSVQTERMVRTRLLAGDLGAIDLSSETDELEPMMSLNGRCSFWLNDLRLCDAKSFDYDAV